MFPALMLYLLMGMIVLSLVFKIVYALFSALREAFGNKSTQPLLKIREMVGGLSCQKDFSCVTQKSDYPGEPAEGGLGALFTCLGKKVQVCTFADTSGERFLCKCPLRLYLRKELQR